MKNYIEPASSNAAPESKGTKREPQEEEERKSKKTTKPGGVKRTAEEEADDSERADRRSWENYVEPASSSQAPDSHMAADPSSTQLCPACYQYGSNSSAILCSPNHTAVRLTACYVLCRTAVSRILSFLVFSYTERLCHDLPFLRRLRTGYRFELSAPTYSSEFCHNYSSLHALPTHITEQSLCRLAGLQSILPKCRLPYKYQ